MGKRRQIAIYQFRRSLRLNDNRALAEAVAHAEQVVPVLNHPMTGSVCIRFLFPSLANRDASLRERARNRYRKVAKKESEKKSR